MTPGFSDSPVAPAESVRAAETALAQLGYRRVTRDPETGPAFWVEDAESPRRTFPVFLWEGPQGSPASALSEWGSQWFTRNPKPGAIFVVPSDRAAEAVLSHSPPRGSLGAELRILVVPTGGSATPKPHWHALVLSPRDLLDVATGVVVGLFRRAQASEGSSEVDFQEMLRLLKNRFRIDLYASLGVDSDEAVLFLLYQLAQKYAFAPGDPSAQLHTLVLRPTGPAARLPWFAA
jgi:hypothetical protein